jgi:GT2 family glycosyltransferase
MANTPEVTVIIPNYNGRQLLINCIRTLECQTFKTFKVLVIDNGSTDGSTGVTSSELDYRLVSLGENTGFCHAVNEGVRLADTPYVILLNNDTEVYPDFVGALLKSIKKSKRIFSCNSMMIDYRKRGIIDNAGDYYTALGWAVSRGKGGEVTSYDAPADVFSCCGGASIYRRDAIIELGGFDEHHFAYLEDVDMGYRARIRGYRNCYEPAAKVLHIGSATTGSRYNEKKVFLAARNSMYLIHKNMPALQIIFNFPLIALGVVIKSIFFAAKGMTHDYLKGIVTGILTCGNLRRVTFERRYFGNYLKIQLELWIDIIKILRKY